MNPYEYRIRLWIKHPEVDLNYLADFFKPNYVWTVGEPRTRPNGIPLDGVYKESYFTADLDDGKKLSSIENTLDKKIEELNAFIEPHKNQFEKLTRSGGEIQFYVSVFIEGNSGIVIRPDILRELANLRIGLSLDIYPPDNDQAAE